MTDADVDEMASDNPIVGALPFLELHEVAARSIHRVHRPIITGVMIAAELWSLELAATRTALDQYNLAEHKIRPATKDAILARMYTSGIFDTPCASSEELLTRACNTATYDRLALRARHAICYVC